MVIAPRRGASPGSPRLRRRTLTLVAWLWIAALAAPDAQRAFDEREIKATYLFNFAQFVEWPTAAFSGPQAPIVIGILGDDPFGAVLDAVVQGEVVKARPLRVVRFRTVEEVGACHLLFVAGSETSTQPGIFAALRGRPIVTVGDTAIFASSGGMIRFVTERNRIRLRINLAAARQSGVVISSQLLRAAEIVGAEEAPR